jgi:hypothetical protein
MVARPLLRQFHQGTVILPVIMLLQRLPLKMLHHLKVGLLLQISRPVPMVVVAARIVVIPPVTVSWAVRDCSLVTKMVQVMAAARQVAVPLDAAMAMAMGFLLVTVLAMAAVHQAVLLRDAVMVEWVILALAILVLDRNWLVFSVIIR